jgi:hypothetical protein
LSESVLFYWLHSTRLSESVLFYWLHSTSIVRKRFVLLTSQHSNCPKAFCSTDFTAQQLSESVLFYWLHST